VQEAIDNLRDVIRADGKLDERAFEIFKNLLDPLKKETGKVPRLLADLCGHVINLKELESKIYDKENAVMQELVKQLQQ
jgi:hypothetical protein